MKVRKTFTTYEFDEASGNIEEYYHDEIKKVKATSKYKVYTSLFLLSILLCIAFAACGIAFAVCIDVNFLLLLFGVIFSLILTNGFASLREDEYNHICHYLTNWSEEKEVEDKSRKEACELSVEWEKKYPLEALIKKAQQTKSCYDIAELVRFLLEYKSERDL